MGDAQKAMEYLNGQSLLTALFVLIAIIAVLKVLDSGVELVKKWKSKNPDVNAQKKSCDAKFANDDRRISDLEDGQRLIVRGVCELLGHELHNGNTQEMSQAENDLKKWLYER